MLFKYEKLIEFIPLYLAIVQQVFYKCFFFIPFHFSFIHPIARSLLSTAQHKHNAVSAYVQQPCTVHIKKVHCKLFIHALNPLSGQYTESAAAAAAQKKNRTNSTLKLCVRVNKKLYMLTLYN